MSCAARHSRFFPDYVKDFIVSSMTFDFILCISAVKHSFTDFPVKNSECKQLWGHSQ